MRWPWEPAMPLPDPAIQANNEKRSFVVFIWLSFIIASYISSLWFIIYYRSLCPPLPPSEPIMSKVLSGGDSPLVPRWSPAHTIYMPIARRLRLREASGQWHALGNLFCQYYWLSAQHHHHLEQNTSDHQLSSNRHPFKHYFWAVRYISIYCI